MIEIVPYDPAWPTRFAEERAALQTVLRPWLVGEIEHIGSTAVPGLAAKPVIDVMAPVASLDASVGGIGAAARAGYLYHPYRAEVMHWFCKPSPQVRTHHLHLVPLGSKLWLERLAFRDALRSDASLRHAYAELKRALAARHAADREAYTEGKTDFVRQVVSRVAHVRL